MGSLGAMEMIVSYEKIMHLNNSVFTYAFDGEKITATYEGESDTFDFTNMPDGAATFMDIDSDLTYNPIITATRQDGILSVTLIEFYF